jgi:uncharacterized integral membrane protein
MDGVSDKHAVSSDSDEGSESRGTARLVILGIAAVLLVWFAVANLGSVSIKFWIAERRAPLILVIVIAGVLGALITLLAQRFGSRRN